MAHTLTRRQFVATGAALTCATVLTSAAQNAGAMSQTMTQPNILLIHGDQHRIDCLGAYGNTEIKTPHIDSIASDGVRFQNSFCPFPVCTPSRYSLLTGLYVHEHRGWTNHSTLPPGTDAFPALLKAAGYKTKAVGKMHFTPTYLDVGFEELELAEQNGPGRWDDDYHRYLRDLGLVDGNDLEDQESEFRKEARPEYWDTFGALASNLPDAHHSTTWIADRAVEALERWGASGNLLMAGFIKPHHPFDPPAEWCERYDPAKLTLLPGWTPQCLARDLEMSRGYFPNEKLTEDAVRRVMAYYYASISHIDHQVGRMLDVLKRKGLYENTMVVYTSDHGEYMGYHHLLLKGNHMYDPLVKVPLIIKYPGGTQRGRVSEGLVSNIDVAPTILSQTGCACGARMKGLDLARDPQGSPIVFCEERNGAFAMARSKTRKLILNRAKKDPLFFDLEKDPFERLNAYADSTYQEEIKQLSDAILNWRSFDALPQTYLDENAPVINQPNVPARDDNHREVLMAYYREKMRGDWAKGEHL